MDVKWAIGFLWNSIFTANTIGEKSFLNTCLLIYLLLNNKKSSPVKKAH